MKATITSISLYSVLCAASLAALVAQGHTRPAPTTPLDTLALPRQDVTLKELNCAEAEFNTHVAWSNGGAPLPLTPSIHRFTVSSFMAMLATAGCSANEQAGLMIRYGADDVKKALKFSYSMTCMDLKWYYESEEGSHVADSVIYEINSSNDLVLSAYTNSTWNAGPSQVFQDKILVDRYDDGTFVKPYEGINGHILFKAATISALIKDNGLAGSDLVEVVPIAEPLTWVAPNEGGDFSVRACLVPVSKNTGRLLSNTVPNFPRFLNRGCDLGSACPPLCKLVSFSFLGTPVRRSC